ncbi:SDR family NAD(P)-dependent oxidoreductase [Nocardia bovistercoris]|uniref:SDR family NAD(P)-dependent oxidoreductase n=1 Tax=Nocardia bovistercoris TaxID=2785916 RepID=A0A931IBE8_9NOCA|nr:SDR family NAD(P)-dependent oxidoreductase [Nocardia bovistercoris]MBH0777496.1 SDR family NAD(P)-dependent oxidoreductase [Nocardia bovistercoris]
MSATPSGDPTSSDPTSSDPTNSDGDKTARVRDTIEPARRTRDLTGRHVVITGASSGIGRAAALAVAAKGATVLVLARRADEIDAVVEEIRAEGDKAYGYRCDVTESESVDKTVAAILDEHGHVDMLVNNAGRSIRRAIHRSTDRLHDFERTMAVNYFGALRMTLALLPRMRERGFGHIVQISSAGVQVATPRFSAYLASKAALDKFTEVAAIETRADGVTFTTIHMPLVRTPMIVPSGTQGPSESPEWAAATIVRALTERPKRIDVPLGTLAEYGALFTPGLRDRILHRYYRALPDSPAAKGEPTPVEAAPAVATPPRPRSAARRVTGSALRRAARWVPGTHW